MMGSILHNYAFNLEFAKRLVEDIADEDMAHQPPGIPNHPAWTLGHLVIGSSFAAMMLGQQPPQQEGWMELFGRKSEPTSDRSRYPSKSDLLGALEAIHAQVAAACEQAGDEQLDQPVPDEEFRQLMPTVRDGLVFLMTAHEATHLGQLAVWRRATGRAAVLG